MICTNKIKVPVFGDINNFRIQTDTKQFPCNTEMEKVGEMCIEEGELNEKGLYATLYQCPACKTCKIN